MKIKRNKKGKKGDKTEESFYPEENNPFADQDASVQDTKLKKKKGKKNKSEDPLKGKKKKIKKTKEKKVKEGKKAKKLKGKRERAVSDALQSHVKANRKKSQKGDSALNGRKHHIPSIIISDHSGIEKPELVENQTVNHNGNKIDPVTTANTGPNVAAKSNELSKDGQLLKPSLEKHPVKAENGKKNRKKKRVSEGDIKSLRNKNTMAQPEPTNPFSLEVDTIDEVTESNDSNPSKSDIVLTSIRTRAHSRRHRTSSIIVSSKERGKKKRLRLVKKWKRMKNKGKPDHEVIEEESCESSLIRESYNPKPAKNLNDNFAELHGRVEEVKEAVSNNISEKLQQRNSGLNQLVDSTEKLQEFSLSFAKVTHETRLKKQNQAKCCGLFSRHRICWYICACEGRIKEKKKKKLNLDDDKSHTNKETRAYADQFDNDDAYEVRDQPASSSPLARVHLRNKAKHCRPHSSHTADSSKRSSTSSLLVGLQSAKLLKNLKRSSIPVMNDESKDRIMSISRRKSSSTGDLSDLINRKARVNKDVGREIRKMANEYEDATMRTRAAELLLLEHEEHID